jgi:ABC-type hemin transport system ATPase subunit
MNRDKEIAIVSVCHGINLASYFRDQVMMIKGGKIRGIGPLGEVITEQTLGFVWSSCLGR